MADLLLKVFLPLSLSIIMLGMGMSLTLKDFTLIFKQPKAVLIGLFNQIILLPLLAFILALAFNLSDTLAVGLIILAACPGGATSNIITQVCNGNLALSVTLTAVTSFTGILSIHLLTSFALAYFNTQTESNIQLPITHTIFQITTITIIPISLGMIILKYKPTFASKMIKPMKIASTIIFALILIGLIASNFEKVSSALKAVGLVTLVLNLSIIGFGFLIPKLFNLEDKDSISVGVDGGIQNATLGIVVATTVLNNIEMAIPTAAYSIWMYITGALLMWIINKRNKTKASLR
ncbi:BASS family bile acid:Na+ symporter [Wenyingzhuangia heitensis]|uniref:BASS family bile acid:Na+ symporter n=1 Tax=Wenyingzhuangia heitensis TaxID=1487859 RepID=A0ABX0UB00_9FLAO|nr:bile acid:sodium symporter family protein [Wenyingzhuangia heitensis]NIJ44237.1 BASS family bile acid:Na+ symporter [Wenyingzhuangia heitensis]